MPDQLMQRERRHAAGAGTFSTVRVAVALPHGRPPAALARLSEIVTEAKRPGAPRGPRDWEPGCTASRRGGDDGAQVVGDPVRDLQRGEVARPRVHGLHR